jgi:hypothetical protein
VKQPPVSYERWVDALRARAKEVDNPRHLEMIDCFIEHMIAERSGDVDRFMATMMPEPVYRSWGAPRPAGKGPSVRRGREIRALYEQMMLRRPGGFPEFELAIERFFVGDDGLAMDGVLHRLHRADELESLGETRPAAAGDEDEFVLSRRTALFISFHEGLMVGEDLYYDSTSRVTAVAT